MYTGSSKKMADILSKQYKTMFSGPRFDSVYTDKTPRVNSNLSDILFTVEDVVAAIDELSNNSGSGPDGVPAILLKKCKGQLSSPLFLLWRNCVDVGMTPGDLKKAHIIPLFKGWSSRLSIHLQADHFNVPSHQGFRKGSEKLNGSIP